MFAALRDRVKEQLRQERPPVSLDELAAGAELVDLLRAHLSGLAGEVDAAGLWDLDGASSLTSWLRDRGGMSNREATRTSTAARRLRDCPVTREAWEAGELTGGQVDAVMANVSDQTAPLFAEHEARVVPLLVGKEQHQTVVLMRNWAIRAKDALNLGDPADAPGTAHLSETMDGRGRLDADLTPDAHRVVRKALQVAAGKPSLDDERSPAQRRHDTLVGVFRFFLDHQDQTTGGQNRAHVNIAVDLDVLETGTGLGLDLDTGTPISAADALRLACDANVHRIITKGKSTTLDYGRATRTVPANLFTVVARRDQGCRFPGCDRPVSWTQAHHIVHWSHGGTTDEWNLALFCDHHHHVIHRPRWRVRLRPNGVIEVTDPSGRIRTSDPPTPPDHAHAA